MGVGCIMGPALHQASRQQEGDVISTKVLSKAMDAEVISAASLINTLPEPVSSDKLPEHVGKNLNVVA